MDPAFLDALASRFNVITIDYSGIGLSTGACATDILSMARDVKDVAEAFKLTKIIVAGWSIGTMVAQTVTTQYPELVSHAILIGTAPPGKNTGVPEKYSWREQRRLLMTSTTGTFYSLSLSQSQARMLQICLLGE
jgi:pimeloyl-ACP methyl ester carboxylesterase